MTDSAPPDRSSGKGPKTTDAPLTSRNFSFAQLVDGDKVPVFATLIQPDCGCRIVGDGTLQHPLRVRACDDHRAGFPAAWQSKPGK